MSIAEPVVARLEQLHDQWTTFSQLPRARLLIWRVADGEATMVESFVARENDDETAETSDLFLRLTSVFRDANTHGLTLAKELVEQYDQVFDVTGEEGTRWKCPARREREDDVTFLLRVLTSFRQHLVGENATKVTLWLDADTEAPDKAYLLWLQRLAQEAPAELRFFYAGELCRLGVRAACERGAGARRRLSVRAGYVRSARGGCRTNQLTRSERRVSQASDAGGTGPRDGEARSRGRAR